MMWGWQEWHENDVGMTKMMWGPQGPRGQHGVETTETTETTEITETTGHGDHMGTFWGLWGWCGHDVDDTGTMWGWHGDDVDDVGMTWMMWGQRGDHGDNKITKNAITFERIEIIEFRLQIWDPWTLPHTCRLQLMCRWGCPIPNGIFFQKVLRWPSKKFFSCFCTGSH